VILSVLPKLRQLDPNIYEAAQDLGATGAVAFRKVILPDLMPGIINGLLIAFTMSIDDFVISYFTAGSQVSTLSMEVYAMARRKISPEINAVSTIMFGSVLLLLVIINLRETHQNWKLKQQQSRLNPKR
jgi:spermidine/putrescine transport system permease protein